MEEEIFEECPHCEGTGAVEATKGMGFVAMCPTCQAVGFVPHVCEEEE